METWRSARIASEIGNFSGDLRSLLIFHKQINVILNSSKMASIHSFLIIETVFIIYWFYNKSVTYKYNKSLIGNQIYSQIYNCKQNL